MKKMKIKLNMKSLFKSIAVVAVMGTATNVNAQDYYHGLGGQYNLGLFNLSYNTPEVDYSGTSGAGVPGAFYKATLGLSDNFAISAYPFLGLSMSANSRTGASGSFGFQLPVNAELWLGDMDDNAFFLGGGFSYGYVGSSDVGGGAIVGPQFALGGQFYVGDRLLGFRGAYSLGLNKYKSDNSEMEITKDSKSLISIGFYYMLGQ